MISHLPMFGRPTCGFTGDPTPTMGEMAFGAQIVEKPPLPEGHELLDSWMDAPEAISCPECLKLYLESTEKAGTP